MRYTGLFAIFMMFACGMQRGVEVRYKKKEPANPDQPYVFADMDRYCFNCHNSSAPKIPLDEEGFKASAKVKARISNGSMPPSAGDFDKDKAIAYIEGESP